VNRTYACGLFAGSGLIGYAMGFVLQCNDNLKGIPF